MSRETLEHLNRNILVGFTDKRGNAWHYRADLQGDRPNHYPGPIPMQDILDRLFNFDVIAVPLFIKVNGEIVQVEGRKAMVTDDTFDTLGIFKDGFQGHGYKTWLVEKLARFVGTETGFGSAGLLRNRGQAFVQIEVPETFKTPQGVDFRPNLLATTSFDGSLATTYKRTVTVAVCDNTVEAGLSESGQQVKVKHTKYSNVRLEDARQALALIEETKEHFEAEVSKLCSWEVTDRQFNDFLSKLVPVPELKPEEGSTRGRTLAISKSEAIRGLYDSDERAATWRGTAFGVLQAVNTYNHHESLIRGQGVSRATRNFENVVSGKFANNDNEALDLLAKICEREYA